MGMIKRARAAARAWRDPLRADAGAEALNLVAGMGHNGGPIFAGADGMNDTGGMTFLNILGSSGGSTPMSEARALSVPAVMRALEVLCGLFAMTPLVYYRRDGDGKVRVDDAPQAIMLRTSANDAQSAFLLKEVMLGDLLMRGKFGGFIHRDALYRPAAMTRLDPSGISSPLQHWNKADGLELFYDASLPDGSRERLSRNDLWYVPGFSRNGLVGIDRVGLLGDTMDAAASTSEFAKRFWDNNAQPSTILTLKAKVEPEEKTRIRTDWQNRFAGPANAGAVAVLDQEMDAKFLAHDNKASQFIETRSFHVVEVARAFGVPPHILFELSRATFSNIEQQSLELYLYTMLGHFERIAAAATHQFAEPGHFYEFLTDALLKGDIKTRYEAYAIAVDKGILNSNEVRSRENLNKREGGDKYRVGSGSMVEGEKPSPPIDHRPPAPPTAPDEED